MVILVLVIEPLTTQVTTQIPDMTVNIAAGVVGVIMAIDIAISVASLLKLNERLRATEEIVNARVGSTLAEAAKVRESLHEKIE